MKFSRIHCTAPVYNQLADYTKYTWCVLGMSSSQNFFTFIRLVRFVLKKILPLHRSFLSSQTYSPLFVFRFLRPKIVFLFVFRSLRPKCTPVHHTTSTTVHQCTNTPAVHHYTSTQYTSTQHHHYTSVPVHQYTSALVH